MPATTFERRGTKTLIALFILRLLPALVILIILLAFIAFRSSLIAVFSINEDIYSFIAQKGFGFFLIITGILAIIALIEYYSLSFSIEENSFRMREGILNIREQSISYRQIQNIDISRPLLYRFIGMSKVVILTAGKEDNDRLSEVEHDNESEGIIDLLDKTTALKLQHELLERSHIQVTSATPLPAIDLHTN